MTVAAGLVLLLAVGLGALTLLPTKKDAPAADDQGQQTPESRKEEVQQAKGKNDDPLDELGAGLRKVIPQQGDKPPEKSDPRREDSPKPKPREENPPKSREENPPKPREVDPPKEPEKPRTPPENPPRPLEENKGKLERLHAASEAELRQQLFVAEEIGLGATAPAVLTSYVANIQANALQLFAGIPHLTDARPLLRARPDLGTLPLRNGASCQLQPGAAAAMERLSRKLRVYLNSVGVARAGGSPALLREVLAKEMRGRRPEWLQPEAVPTMVQMLMAEEALVRQILVDMLAQINTPSSTTALAQRAVFDLDADVRRSAVASLKNRRSDDYRPVILRALRYPWEAAAQHAAEAIALLDEKGIVPELISLLKLPDPRLPVILNRNYAIVRDVVRTNHVNNCLMCHPPATTANEPVLGVDPVMNIPTTAGIAAAVQNLQRTPGSHGYGGNRPVGPLQVPLLIRGDITFLRQDFSVQQPVNQQAQSQGGGSNARFDYVVRTRYFPVPQAQQILKEAADTPYAQRTAVLHALRKLTGKDSGETTESWLEAFPRAEQDAVVAQQSRALVQATAFNCEVTLNKMRNAPGEVPTLVLTMAIPSLRGKLQQKARDILSERLSRATPHNLVANFRDDDPEVRRAVLQACQQKEKKEVVPALIALLRDPDPVTAKTVEAALKDLTGKEHPSPADWESWWNEQ